MISLFNKVLWKNKICIVTNAHYGTKIQISPVGNGNAPAKYYIVRNEEIKLLCNPCAMTYVTICRDFSP